MEIQKEYLDLIFVPSGLLIMFGYHLFLLNTYFTSPDSTTIGRESKDKNDWVESVVEGYRSKDLDRAANVITSNTTAASYLATITLTLSSLIGTWLGTSSSLANYNLFQSQIIYGDTRPFTIFVKDLCLLACLLLAFSGFVNATRHLVHANYLLSSTDNKNLMKQIQFAVIKGGDFWMFGLRSLYFSLNVLLWFFGPIPMFAGSIVMAVILYYHDIHTVKLYDSYYQSNFLIEKSRVTRTNFTY